MTGFRISEKAEWLALRQPFLLESGEALPEVKVAYRSWGKLSPNADNAIILCHALTGSADADAWWPDFFGPGKLLDPRRHFIVCSNVLGGCYGTTGPTSLAPDGHHWGPRFPRVTVRDQVRLQMLLADHLGIASIHGVIGGSLGGLQALEWALLDKPRVRSVISLAASGRHSPWCIAWSEAQRLALKVDPAFRDGCYAPDKPPLQGMAAARAIAMVSYRNPASLEERFGRANGQEVFAERAKSPDAFAVQNWLQHHGQALARRFDANSYLCLLDAMDTHDLGRGRGHYAKALRQIEQPVLVGSIDSDVLYGPEEQKSLVSGLPNADLYKIRSPHGHDAFLIDSARIEARLRHFLEWQESRGMIYPCLC